MSAPPREIPLDGFAQDCADLLHSLIERGEELLITEQGRAIAKVVPAAVEAPAKRDIDAAPMRDAVLFMGDIVSPLDLTWAAAGDSA